MNEQKSEAFFLVQGLSEVELRDVSQVQHTKGIS